MIPFLLFIDEDEQRAVIEILDSRSLFRYYGPNLRYEVARFFKEEYCT